MEQISKQIMRIALLLMLFQFFAPSFFPLIVREVSSSKGTNYHVQHNSIVAPLLLKEKEEKEHEENVFTPSQTPLLDFTDHSTNLTATHTGKSNYLHSELLYDLHPALFTCYCTFLI